MNPKIFFFQFLNKITWQFINKILGFMQINASISPKTIFKKIRKIAKNFLKSNWTGQQFSWFFNIFFPKSKAPKKKNHLKKKRGKCDRQSEQVRRDFCWCSAPCICGPSFRVWGPGSKAFNHLRSGKEMIEPTWRLFFLFFFKKKEEKQSFSFSSNFSVRQHGAGTSLKEKVERSRFQSGNMAAQTEIFGCETKRSGNELCSWLG